MNIEEVIDVIADELDKYARGLRLDPDDPDYEENVRYDARYLYNKIAGSIQANAYETSAERMKQLLEMDSDGVISIQQAVEYLEDAAARARNE